MCTEPLKYHRKFREAVNPLITQMEEICTALDAPEGCEAVRTVLAIALVQHLVSLQHLLSAMENLIELDSTISESEADVLNKSTVDLIERLTESVTRSRSRATTKPEQIVPDDWYKQLDLLEPEEADTD